MKNTLISLAFASVAFACSSAPASAGPSRFATPPAFVAPIYVTPIAYVAPTKAYGSPRAAVVLVPNYSAKLEHRLSWTNLPVRVFFVPDKNYHTDLETVAKRGFDHWTRATLGFARYVVVRVPQQADIFVRFNPDLNGGLTKTHFRKGRLYRADMTVGVAQDESDDIECTAAHEFGHALGIDGHSDDRADLMFPVHVIGRSFRITESDVNTLATAYNGLARRLASQREARAGEPSGMGL